MNNGHGLALALSINQQQHKDFWQKSGKFSQLGTFCSMAAGGTRRAMSNPLETLLQHSPVRLTPQFGGMKGA